MAERKWLTEPDEYECKLSEETQQIAKEELREDPQSRNQALASFRQWIMTNPRIVNCRLDAKFLLRFLRTKKFSVTHAQEALERYLLLRQTYGVAFHHLDITIPMVEELIDRGFIFPCPKRDSKGRRVWIGRGGEFDLDRYTSGDLLRAVAMCAEVMMEDEENQVRGYVYFGDAEGGSLACINLFSPKEAVRLVKNGEKTIPARHKEVHGINVPTSLKFLVDFGLSLVSEKIRKRVYVYTNLQEALTSGNLEPDILPKEYGGIMPMKEMIAIWKQELVQHRDMLLMHDQMEVREALFTPKEREGAVSALKRNGQNNCGGEEDTLRGVMGNFRKLEID